jgi:drug/metabolite transporter (DMT)-like permease
MPPGETDASPGGRDIAGGALVALSALLFGTVVILGRSTADSGIPVTSVLALRFAMCAAILAAVLAVARRPLIAARGERIGLLAAGGIGYALESSFFFAALRHGNAAPATLLFYTYPAFVMVASWALGRGRPTRLHALALVLGVSGATIVVAGGADLSIERLGVVLALCSAITYTAYILGAERVIDRTQPLTSSLWTSAAAATGLAIAAAVSGTLRAPSRPADWLTIAAMGVATAGAFATLFAGLRRIGAVRTSIVSSAEPLAAALLAFAFLGESVGVSVAVGGVLIVTGAIVAALSVSAPPAEPPLP